MSTINFKDYLGTSSGNEQQMLGKFLYFSLPAVLVEKDALTALCENMGIPFAGGKRLSVSDAFRSATGDVRDRIVVKYPGDHRIIEVYCRDNARAAGILSRELIKESLHQDTNQYKKLANIYYDKADQSFGYGSIVCDEDVETLNFCQRAERLFDLYQHCANRRQIETICLNYLRSLEATKLSGTGHNFFVPRQNMAGVDVFEDFIDAINEINLNQGSLLTANSFFIIDSAKQREKMSAEFYSALKKEITEYQERADYLIKSGSTSPSIMERWVNKITTLEEKKHHYEDVLRRELDGLDDEFETLKFLSQELSIRSKKIRAQRGWTNQKCA